jgi:hypothetical protein
MEYIMKVQLASVPEILYFVINPLKQVGPYKDRFLPLRERSELP